MSDSEIKLELIRLIDSQGGKSLMRLYELIREEIGPGKSKANQVELSPLEQGYKAMSEDEEREEEVFAWIEGTLNSEDL